MISKIEERLQRIPPNKRPVLPTQLLAQKQLFFQCGEEMTTRRDVELIGEDCLLWASDFPHEATRTDLKTLVKEFLDRRDLGRGAKSKILYNNPKRFYALSE
jgi:predicted TIM-barrel fold metal-dependent hydrolase